MPSVLKQLLFSTLASLAGMTLATNAVAAVVCNPSPSTLTFANAHSPAQTVNYTCTGDIRPKIGLQFNATSGVSVAPAAQWQDASNYTVTVNATQSGSVKLSAYSIGYDWSPNVSGTPLTVTVGSGPAPTSDYLMWQMPASGITFPVYVYSAGKQVAYIPSDSLQVFAGPYAKGQTSASYQLYYQNDSKWYTCSVILQNGAINNAASTCAGSVINPPATYTDPTTKVISYGNVWTLAVPANAFPVAPQPPINPAATDYSARTITFQNNTNYPMIHLHGTYCNAFNPNPKDSSWQCPSYTTVDQNISAGASYVQTTNTNGMNSAAFHITAFCTAASAADCPADMSGQYWTQVINPPQGTGIPTKFEATILPVTNGVPNGASNTDLSAVDGYANIGAIVYPVSPIDPTGPVYCTYTVPPENSNLLGAGTYSQSQPLAKIEPASVAQLQSLCPDGAGSSVPAWNLQVLNGGAFTQCISPCQYALIHSGLNSDEYNQYCCAGPYNSPDTCTAPLASSYVKNIGATGVFNHVYTFAYSDAAGDYACPPETNLVVNFITAAQ